MIWLELAGAMLSSGILGFAIGHARKKAVVARAAKDGVEAHWADVCAGLTFDELQKRVKP